MVAVRDQRKGICGCHTVQQSRSSNQNSLTCRDLWQWLVDHYVAEMERHDLIVQVEHKALILVNLSLI